MSPGTPPELLSPSLPMFTSSGPSHTKALLPSLPLTPCLGKHVHVPWLVHLHVSPARCCSGHAGPMSAQEHACVPHNCASAILPGSHKQGPVQGQESLKVQPKFCSHSILLQTPEPR